MPVVPKSRSSAAPPVGEFLFKEGDLVFGPVPASLLVEKLERGELPPETPVAREGAAFAPMGEVSVFMEHAALAAARRRVEEQARADASARRSRRIVKAAIAGAVAAGAAGLAVVGVIAAIRAGVFETESRELAEIRIQASPTLVAIAPAGGRDEEYEYLGDDAPAAGSARKRTAEALPARGREADGAAVERNYDSAGIQAIVRSNQQRLFPCIREEAARNPSFRGDLPFSFTVGNEGRVVRLWIDRHGYEKGPLHACMEAQLAQWKFPRFQGERPSVSLSFRVGGG